MTPGHLTLRHSESFPTRSRSSPNLTRRGELAEGPQLADVTAAFSARLGGVSAITASYGRMAFYYILKALRCPRRIGDRDTGADLLGRARKSRGRRDSTPVFADVDPATFNMTADCVRARSGAAR